MQSVGIFCRTLAFIPALALAGIDRVIEDVPGRLVLEVRMSDVTVRSVPGQGVKVGCALCSSQSESGLPDLPRYHFTVLTGASMPRVTISIVASETRNLSERPASVPFYPSPSRIEYRPNAEGYLSAARENAIIGEPHWLRGATVRDVDVPLALWSEANKTLILLKRVRVEMTFAGLNAARSAGLREPFIAAVKNPIGGAYLMKATHSPHFLAKRAASSIVATFFKIKIGDRIAESFNEDGLYGLSFDDLARVSGDISGARIANLRMYAGGDDTLPRAMGAAPTSFGTLRTIPMEVVDANRNGTFDGGDSIFFFGHGTSIWKRLPGNQGTIRFAFSADPYSFENNYYLDFSGNDEGSGAAANGAGLRIDATPAPTAQASVVDTVSMYYLRAGKDLQTTSCDQASPSARDEESGFFWFWFWRGACDRQVLPLTLKAAELKSQEVDALPDWSAGKDSLFVGVSTYPAAGRNDLKVYMGGRGDTLGYLDDGSVDDYYVRKGPPSAAGDFHLDSLFWGGATRRFLGYSVCYPRRLAYSGNPIRIFPMRFGTTVTYEVRGGESLNCLRVESGVATRKMFLDERGRFTDSLAPDADAYYYLYRKAGSIPQDAIMVDAAGDGKAAIRDLETGDGLAPEYLIITPRILLKQADELRDFRNQPQRAFPVKTAVVAVEDIYRQFSGGRLSPTAIRDFLRWAYNRWGAGGPTENPLKYVLLFGDGNFDYRNIRATLLSGAPPNLIPPYEDLMGDAQDKLIGFASDDFYGLLDSGETLSRNSALDLSIGRVPVQTPKQAEDYLQKVRDYEDPSKAGAWRGRMTLAADDATQRGAPGDLDIIGRDHTAYSEEIGRAVAAQDSGMTIDKIYLLDYAMNSSFQKPEAAQDLLSSINRGALVVNFFGHGASNQWADEVLLKTNDALSRMQNQGMTPMINAFSCTVGRFDALTSEGMSEQFVKQKSVGAIAAIAATRETYPDQNFNLAHAFYARALSSDSARPVVAIGDALRDAKNSDETKEYQYNDAKYVLLGEPVLILRKPPLRLAFTQMLDTIKALDCSTISGHVYGGSGEGFINLKIVAGSVRKTYSAPGVFDSLDVEKRGNILFEKTLPYKDFNFTTDYFIPKQVSFGDTDAQITAFAWDARQELEGTWAKEHILIKGTAKSACANDADGRGPRISVTGCERKETGDIDFPDRMRIALPYCLQIQVEDSIGGVISAEGPDEGTTVEIPGVFEPFHPKPSIDELYRKSYQVALGKKDMRPGPHLLKITARDGYGNVGQRQLTMEVGLDSSVNAFAAYNSPNPMKRNGTVFYFSAAVPSMDGDFTDVAKTDRIDFEIRIFNQAGRLVKRFFSAQSGATAWDGHDEWGNLLANGVYFYTVTARENSASVGPDAPDYRLISSKRSILVISR